MSASVQAHIRNAWYVAAWSGEITRERLFSRKLFGKAVVFFRADDGTLAALDDKCSHRAAPLSCGRREGSALRCMYHGLMFDSQGACIEVPGQTRISPKLDVRSYPVCERDGLVWLWPGDPALADPAAIVRADTHGNPEWNVIPGGYIHFAADCALVADNLLDFSHLAFVHGGSIGSPELAASRPDVERFDEKLRITYRVNGGARPPNYVKLSRLPERVDRELSHTWHVRGNVFVQNSWVAPADTGGVDSLAPETVRKRTFIMLTPETATSSHYFWSSAHNNYLSDVPRLTEVQNRKLAEAFEEDRAIIEAQQRLLIEEPDTQMQPIASDACLYDVRRIVERILAQEASPPAAPRLRVTA